MSTTSVFAVSVIGKITGAGGIGQPLSLLLKTQLPAGSTLSLYDVVDLVYGVGVDLSHIPTDVKVTAHNKQAWQAFIVKATRTRLRSSAVVVSFSVRDRFP